MTKTIVQYHLPDEATTLLLAKALVAVIPNGAVIFLYGDLGAGKTALVRGMLRQLGVVGTVRSPTYTLVEMYDTPSRRVFHLDLYRIAAAEELHYLGLEDVDAKRDLLCVEWPDHGAAGLPLMDLSVALAVSGDGRVATLSANTEQAASWLVSLKTNIILDRLRCIT